MGWGVYGYGPRVRRLHLKHWTACLGPKVRGDDVRACGLSLQLQQPCQHTQMIKLITAGTLGGAEEPAHATLWLTVTQGLPCLALEALPESPMGPHFIPESRFRSQHSA